MQRACISVWFKTQNDWAMILNESFEKQPFLLNTRTKQKGWNCLF